MNTSTFRLACFVPWGDGAQQVVLKKTDAYPAGLALQPGKIVSAQELSFRIDANGDFHFWDQAGQKILHCGNDGNFLNGTPLPEGISPIDWQAADDAYIILSATENGARNLRKINIDGSQSWTIECAEAPFKDASQILFDGETLFLTARNGNSSLMEIDEKTGETKAVHNRVPGAIRSDLIENTVQTIAYFPEERRRGLSSYNLKSKTETKAVWGKEWYGPLSSAIGSSKNGQFFLYTHTGTESAKLISVDSEQKVHTSESFFGIAVQEDSRKVSVASYSAEKHQIEIRTYGNTIDTVQFQVPQGREVSESNLAFRKASNSGEFQFDLKSPHGSHEVRLSLGTGHEAKEIAVAEGNHAARMQSPTTWIISTDGSVYIPVSTESGLFIIKMQ